MGEKPGKKKIDTSDLAMWLKSCPRNYVKIQDNTLKLITYKDFLAKFLILKMTLKFSAYTIKTLIFKYLNEGHSPVRQFRLGRTWALFSTVE